MSEPLENQVPTDASELSEELQVAVAQYNEVRMANAKKLMDLDRIAQTDIRPTITILRLNLLIDALLGNDEERLSFERRFEDNVSPVLDRYLSEVNQAILMQGIKR